MMLKEHWIFEERVAHYMVQEKIEKMMMLKDH